jgi:Na+-driven multidrug efflux pump/anti-sigma regulatory factor (Ser/Thr protein kinase)
MENVRNNLLLKRKFMSFWFPTVISTAALSIAAIIDNILVGQFLSEKDLAAIGTTSPFVFGLNMVALIFMIGGVITATTALGRHNKNEAQNIYTAAVTAGIIGTALYGILVLAFIDPISMFLVKGNAELSALAKAYIFPTAFVGPFVFFTLAMSQFMRSEGRAKLSAAIPIIANVCDLILGFVFLKYTDLGITGAGLSTTLSYVIGVFLTLPYILSKDRQFRFKSRSLFAVKEFFTRIKAICERGLSKSLTQGMSLVRTLLLNLIILSFLGGSGMTVMTIITSTTMFVMIIIGGTSDTLTPITAALFGERDIFGIKSAARRATGILIIGGISVTALLFAFPEAIAAVFGIKDTAVTDILIPAIRMYVLYLPFYGITYMLQNFYSATGHTKLSTAIAALDNCILAVFFILIIALINPYYIWLGYLIAEVSMLVIIFSVTAIKNKRNHTKSVLMLPEESSEKILDLTITPDVNSAVEISTRINEFCLKEGILPRIATAASVAAEEMAVNTAKYGGNKRSAAVDILVRISDEKLLLRIRDDGVPFDPLSNESGEFSGIAVVKKIAEKLEYGRQLGFNNTLISFNIDVE